MSEIEGLDHIHRHKYTHPDHQSFHKDCLECWECQREESQVELAETKVLITSYQIAKDNLELRLVRAVLANEKPIVGTFAGHWTY